VPSPVKSLSAWFQASKAWRAWSRYGDARGNILAAGVGYFAFFSIFPAVALAFTVFGFVLQGHPDLLLSITNQFNAYLPGLIRNAQHPEGLVEFQVPAPTALTVTGVIAVAALVLGGLGWLGAVREGVRAVFGAPGPVGNLVTTKLRDLGVLLTLGLGIALFAVLSSVVGGAAGWIADWVGLPGDGWIVGLAGFAVSVLADTGLMMILLRVVSDVAAPWRDLFQAALVGGVGFTVLKLSAAVLLPRLTSNPLYASFAVVVGLLIWLNLIARLTLISAAWAANDLDVVRDVAPRDSVSAKTQIRTAGAGARVTDAETADRPGTAAARGRALPTFGARSADRTTLAAGAVLGATAVTTTRALVRGIRSAVRLVKG
jgi:membrane protein